MEEHRAGAVRPSCLRERVGAKAVLVCSCNSRDGFERGAVERWGQGERYSEGCTAVLSLRTGAVRGPDEVTAEAEEVPARHRGHLAKLL